MTKPKPSDRTVALQILLQVIQNHQPLSQLLQQPGISSLTKALCFGVIRHFIRLESVADSLVIKRPKDLSVWCCILLGLFQLDDMNMPDYAVVQETVALLSHLHKTWAKGFVNALLRRYCREQGAIQQALATHPEYQYNHPKWLLQTIQQAWPHEWQAILAANDTHPPMALRINLAKITREAYCKQLAAAEIAYTLLPHTVSGILLDTPCAVDQIPGFIEGEISVQDGAAQLAGPLLTLAPGLRVLDACCAPGGKLGQILELETHLSYCLGIDIEAKRLPKVKDNCRRLHLDAAIQVGDASHPKTWWDGVTFDRILIDAPCSATGIIRRHPDIKLLRTPDDIVHITALQKDILNSLWPLLAPNGILVYATCSILPKENEEQIASFIARHPDAIATITPQRWGQFTGHGWQILPGKHAMDGFFYAQITKKRAD